MRVCIGGLPGSGTTTAAYLLADRTGLEVVSAGEVFRQMAREMGVTLAAFGRMAQKDEEIDAGLDRRMLSIARKKDEVILEGRLIGALCKKERMPALKIWLHAPASIRSARISGREDVGVERAVRDMLERENSERTRYMRYYGIDMDDLSIYDMIIDSETNAPEVIVEMIQEGMN